jgi:uncharacterized protein YggE
VKTRHILWLAAGLLAASLFAGVGAPMLAHGVDAKPGTVTVNGTGSVDAVPDTATFAFGVTTEAKTAVAALAQDADAATKVIAALKKAGIADKDVQTQSVSLSPRYTDRGDEILGYTASSTVSVILRSLGNAGAVIDAAVAAGANNVSGPSLSRADTDALYRAALKEAVAAARTKAEALGEAGQFSVGKIDSLVEGSNEPPVPMSDRAAAPATPIEPGTQQITASVTVSFELS